MSNKKKAEQLGMPHGTAGNRLRKRILFALIREAELDTCCRCNKKIEDVSDLSIEHIVPWLDSKDPIGLFFDLDNIAFSHLRCNIGSARKPKAPHGSARKYGLHGCRCSQCTEANTVKVRKYRKNLSS